MGRVCASIPLGLRLHCARTPDVNCRILNRLGMLQNLWDKAIEAKKERPIHPMLRDAGLTAGMGTLAEQAGRPWAAGATFRSDRWWSGSASSDWRR